MKAGLAFDLVHAGYGQARVLHGVSLEVAAGERVALLGRNGVGKTTLVNTLSGVASLRSGRITIEGRALGRPRGYDAATAGVAIVPQGRRILPNLTVEENLRLGAAARRPGPWTSQRVKALFPILAERARQPGTALSGGQQQMLAIGRALMANPRIIILDEPSEGLAPVIVDVLAEIFIKLADEEGMGLLLIEQTISLVQRVATACYVMSKGEIVDRRSMAQWSGQAMQDVLTV